MDTALFDKTGGSEVVSTTEQTNRKLTKGDNCIVVLFMDVCRSWLVVISCSRRSTVLPIYGSVYAAAAGPVRTKTRPDARCIIGAPTPKRTWRTVVQPESRLKCGRLAITQ